MFKLNVSQRPLIWKIQIRILPRGHGNSPEQAPPIAEGGEAAGLSEAAAPVAVSEPAKANPWVYGHNLHTRQSGGERVCASICGGLRLRQATEKEASTRPECRGGLPPAGAAGRAGGGPVHPEAHMHNLSDKTLCARWRENPYYQFFCDELSFCHRRRSTACNASRSGKSAGDALGRVGAECDAGVRPSDIRFTTSTAVRW